MEKTKKIISTFVGMSILICTEYLCLVQVTKNIFVENIIHWIRKQPVKLLLACSCMNFHRNCNSCHSHRQNSTLLEKRERVCWFVDRNFWSEVIFKDSQRWVCWQALVVLLVMEMLFWGITLQHPRKEMFTRKQTKWKVMLKR